MYKNYHTALYLVLIVSLLLMFSTTLVLADGPEPVLVKDITPGRNYFGPANLTPVNGTLFFTASDDVHGRELWKLEVGDTPNVPILNQSVYLPLILK